MVLQSCERVCLPFPSWNNSFVPCFTTIIMVTVVVFYKDPFIPLAQKDLLLNDKSTKPAQKFWSEKSICWCIFSAFATSVFSVCPDSRAIFGQKCHATFHNFEKLRSKMLNPSKNDFFTKKLVILLQIMIAHVWKWGVTILYSIPQKWAV